MNSKIKRITIDAILLALLIVASKIALPIGPISLTLQLFVVLVICLTVAPSDALIILASYIVCGLFGLPVFATAYSGIGYLYVPSFGFILGFMGMALAMFFMKRQKLISKDNKYYYFLTTLVLIAVDYLFGFLYAVVMIKVFMVIDLEISTMQILCKFIIVFIPFDIIKGVIASIVGRRINNSTVLD
ncbi:MAG TPA: biotin transporter BioY [Bacilli bacterium]|nr:biotin transporter BioY [Bacilli bacterium]